MPACHATRPAAFARILATLVVCFCAMGAADATAAGPAGALYKGLTSQQEPIRFTIASAHVRRLSFYIVISCASHKSYSGHVWGFSPIAIHKRRFAETVLSTNPTASATISGRIGGHRVRGSVHLRRYIATEHGFCKGAATFDLKRSG